MHYHIFIKYSFLISICIVYVINSLLKPHDKPTPKKKPIYSCVSAMLELSLTSGKLAYSELNSYLCYCVTI